jgi:hypothetical protein
LTASLQVSSMEFCSTGGYEDRTSAQEAEESPLLEPVARERLMTQQAGKRLSGCCGDLWSVEISDGDVITCSSESCVYTVNKSNRHSIPLL